MVQSPKHVFSGNDCICVSMVKNITYHLCTMWFYYVRIHLSFLCTSQQLQTKLQARLITTIILSNQSQCVAKNPSSLYSNFTLCLQYLILSLEVTSFWGRRVMSQSFVCADYHLSVQCLKKAYTVIYLGANFRSFFQNFTHAKDVIGQLLSRCCDALLLSYSCCSQSSYRAICAYILSNSYYKIIASACMCIGQDLYEFVFCHIQC